MTILVTMSEETAPAETLGRVAFLAFASPIAGNAGSQWIRLEPYERERWELVARAVLYAAMSEPRDEPCDDVAAEIALHGNAHTEYRRGIHDLRCTEPARATTRTK